MGLIGTILGAVIAGLAIFLNNKQQQSFETKKINKEILLKKYEIIFKDLSAYTFFANAISLEMLSEVGYENKFNIKGLKDFLKDSNLTMNVMFYAPEISYVLEDIEKQYLIIFTDMSEFLLKVDIKKERKTELITRTAGNAKIMNEIIEKAQEKLTKLVNKQLNA